MYRLGNPVRIIVDDRLPVGGRNGDRPVLTSKSSNGAWWMPILEKAYAKLNQSYINLHFGMGELALRDLTGMPIKSYNALSQSEEEFFNIVNDADDRKYVMTAGCQNASKDLGLVNHHLYSVIGAVELSNGVKLIRMRNPWGREMYKGAYRDNDPVWTDKLKAEV